MLFGQWLVMLSLSLRAFTRTEAILNSVKFRLSLSSSLSGERLSPGYPKIEGDNRKCDILTAFL